VEKLTKKWGLRKVLVDKSKKKKRTTKFVRTIKKKLNI
jgi:hypothetical protein